MSSTPSNTFRLNVIAPSSWTPPYSLPPVGTTNLITVSGGNLAESSGVRPDGWTTQQQNYSVFGSYGGGVFAEQYSTAGAYIFGPTGGHQHPDNTGCVVFDFTTGLWSRLEHANGGPRYSTNDGGSDPWFDLSELTGDPYYEVIGATNVPGPGHPYAQSIYLPPSMGGGTKGSIVVVRHGTLGPGGTVMSHTLHRFDLATRVWTRATNNLLRSGKGSESPAWLDISRQRIWAIDDWQFNFQSVEYVQLPGWTVGTVSQGNWTPTGINVYKSFFMHAGLLYIQTQEGKLWMFDPDNGTLNWRICTLNGGDLISSRSRFTYHPTRGKFYQITRAGGGTLHRLAPTANPLVWDHDTVSVSPGVPTKWNYGPGDTEHYTMLCYVPSIDRLAWMTNVGVYLINPA